jgi:hypothetical protein
MQPQRREFQGSRFFWDLRENEGIIFRFKGKAIHSVKTAWKTALTKAENKDLLHPENLPENEVHRAVSEKIQEAISSMLNQKIEEMVKQKVKKEDIELAADRLFSMANQGSTEEDIERELKRTSATELAWPETWPLPIRKVSPR